MRVVVALLLALLVSSTSATAKSAIYEGVYLFRFGERQFVPKGSHDSWVLKGADRCVEKYAVLTDYIPKPSILYLKVQGSLSPRGRYGLSKTNTHELQISEVLVCRRASKDEYEF
jgi:hypothetical protein